MPLLRTETIHGWVCKFYDKGVVMVGTTGSRFTMNVLEDESSWVATKLRNELIKRELATADELAGDGAGEAALAAKAAARAAAKASVAAKKEAAASPRSKAAAALEVAQRHEKIAAQKHRLSELDVKDAKLKVKVAKALPSVAKAVPCRPFRKLCQLRPNWRRTCKSLRRARCIHCCGSRASERSASRRGAAAYGDASRCVVGARTHEVGFPGGLILTFQCYF